MKTLGAMRSGEVWCREFVKHAGGSLTIPAILLFTVLMGVGGLAIDLQRLYGVHGQMQAYVDGAALAGAAELDGQGGAIARAKRAVLGDGVGPLVTGTGWQTFATNSSLGVRKLIFLSSLGSPDPAPTDPSEPHAVDVPYVLCTIDGGVPTPANCDASATVDRDARFVEVLAAPRTVSYVVLPVADVIGELMGAAPITSSATLRLRATAGFKQSVCDINPLMICNPDEPAGNGNFDYPFNAAAHIGTQILLKAGGGSAWGPGDFGWIDVATDAGIVDCQQGGNQDSGCVLGLVNPVTQCFSNNRVNVSQGQGQSNAEAINVRFDMYPSSDNLGPAHNVHTDNRFAPSVNVTKGICNVTGGANKTCDYSTPAARCPNPNGNGFALTTTVTDTNARSMKMPRDQSWDPTGRFGNGVWDRAGYWSRNHGGDSLPISLATATRYQVYRHEIDCSTGVGMCFGNDGIPNYSPASDNGENGNHIGGGTAKYCSTQPGVNNSGRDRRVLYVAVVNCKATGLNGNSTPNVHVVAYLKVFVTEPVGFDSAGNWVGVFNAKDVYGEVVEVVKPNDSSSIVHVYPVLYR